jgi:isopentenyldiphosphate isomerase
MVGRPCGEIIPDPAEVVEVRAFSPKQLAADIAERPDDFAPWLVRCLQAISPDALVLGSVRSETVTPAVILLDPPDAPGAN